MKKDRKPKKEQLSQRDSEFSADIEDSLEESEDNHRPSARNIENPVYNRTPSMVFGVKSERSEEKKRLQEDQISQRSQSRDSERQEPSQRESEYSASRHSSSYKEELVQPPKSARSQASQATKKRRHESGNRSGSPTRVLRKGDSNMSEVEMSDRGDQGAKKLKTRSPKKLIQNQNVDDVDFESNQVVRKVDTLATSGKVTPGQPLGETGKSEQLKNMVAPKDVKVSIFDEDDEKETDFLEEIEHMIRVKFEIEQGRELRKLFRKNHEKAVVPTVEMSDREDDQQDKNDNSVFEGYHNETDALENFAKDAANGFLSHSKMVDVVRKRHLTIVQDKLRQQNSKLDADRRGTMTVADLNFKKFQCCGTSTGWFCKCCPCRNKSDLQEHLGSGVSIYFKQLKNLIVMLLLCTLLSVPAFVLFWSGKSLNNPDTQIDGENYSFNTYIASLSLANLGDLSFRMNTLDLDKDVQTVELFCETGKIGNISNHGIGKVQRVDNEIDYFEDTYCKTPIYSKNEESFESKCKGNQHCLIEFELFGAVEYKTYCYFDKTPEQIRSEYALFFEFQCDIQVVELAYFGEIPRFRLSNIVIVCDAIICLLFAINTCWLGCAVTSEQYNVDVNYVQMHDFSVRIKNLPNDKSKYETLDQLKAQLALHCSDVVRKEPQVLEKLRESQQQNVDEIVNIYFAHSNFQIYKLLIQIENSAKEGQKLHIMSRNCKNPQQQQKIEQKIQKIKERILQDATHYSQVVNNEKTDQIKNAFVTFRTMEGAARMIKAYNKSWINMCCLSCCSSCCVDKKNYNRKLFHKKWLSVDQAPEPALIMWENLGITKKGRCIRILLQTIISLILLLATTVLILYVKVQETELKSDKITCAIDQEVELTAEKAFADLQLPKNEQSNLMYCYCQGLFWTNVKANKNPYNDLQAVFEDGNDYCWDWFGEYSLSKTLLYTVPLSIVFVNFIAKTFLRIIAKMSGFQSKPEEVLSAAINMSLMAFINSGLVIQLVYFNWWPQVDVPLLPASYDEFTQEWYEEVGVTIVLTLMLMVITPHLSNLSFQLMYAFKRCLDRSCTCDSKKTKTLTQEDYEDMYTGAEFMFEFRYSNMLTVLGVAFLYSGGMPILYPTAAFFFLLTYWMDKFLLLKCYRKPIKFDNYLAKGTLAYFKYILFLHIIGFLFMYGLTPILQNNLFEQFEPKEIGQISEEDVSLFPIYFWLIALVLTFYVVYVFIIGSCVKITKMCCSKDIEFIKTNYNYDQDFYQSVNIKTLQKEIKESGKEEMECKEMYDTARHNQNYLKPDSLKTYINMVHDRREHQKDHIHYLYKVVRPKSNQDLDYKVKIKKLLPRMSAVKANNKMQGDVQSYDILCNEKYQRLQELKYVLEHCKK